MPKFENCISKVTALRSNESIIAFFLQFSALCKVRHKIQNFENISGKEVLQINISSAVSR